MRTRAVRAKMLPLPESLRRLIAQAITRAFLRDVNDFLFDAGAPRRDGAVAARSPRGRRRSVRRDRAQPGLDDRLRRAAAARSDASSRFRCSSPSARRSGLQEVQDVLRQWTGRHAAVSAMRQPLGQRRRPARSRRVRHRHLPTTSRAAIENVSRHRPQSRTARGTRIPAPATCATEFVQERGSRSGRHGLRAGDRAVRHRQGPGRRSSRTAHRDERHPTLIQLAERSARRSAQPRPDRGRSPRVEPEIVRGRQARRRADPDDVEIDAAAAISSSPS